MVEEFQSDVFISPLNSPFWSSTASLTHLDSSCVIIKTSTHSKYTASITLSSGLIVFCSRTHSSSCCLNRQDCCFNCEAAYTPYNGGEVCSDLGLDKSFVEGSVWSGDHQGGQQAESEAFKCVGDTVETPEQMNRYCLTKESYCYCTNNRRDKWVNCERAVEWSYSPSRKLTHSVFCLDGSGARASGLQVTWSSFCRSQ